MNSPHADGHSPVGFPHSEISGSKPVSDSPELIAAFHVLLRLWLPRHPPYALCSLTLSLRHASSRVRDSTRESESCYAPFVAMLDLLRFRLEVLQSPALAPPVACAPGRARCSCAHCLRATLGRYDRDIGSGRSVPLGGIGSTLVDFSFVSYSIVNELLRHCRPPRNAAVNRIRFVELIGIEPTTSGLQSQRSPN